MDSKSSRPHISFKVSFRNSSALQYGYYDGTNWIFQTVDSGSLVGFDNSLAIDSRGRPHLAYYDLTAGDLRYASYDGTNWNVEIVDGLVDTGWYASLALDAHDRPHVAYWDRSRADLRYATWNGSRWYLETVDGVGYVGENPTLALDSAGHPHIAYRSSDTNDHELRYAHGVPIPEPSAATLLPTGLVFVVVLTRRRRTFHR